MIGFGRVLKSCRGHRPDEILADFDTFSDDAADADEFILGVVPSGEAIARQEQAEEGGEGGEDERAVCGKREQGGEWPGEYLGRVAAC